MNVVAYTAGVPASKGYSYRTSGCEEKVAHEFGKVMDDQSKGIAVKKENGSFSVAIYRLPTLQIDFCNRNIAIFLTLTGLTETDARALLRFYLDNVDTNWETATAPLTRAFEWNEQDEQGWTVDFDELKRGIDDITKKYTEDSVPNKPFSDRWEKENTAATRGDLSEKLKATSNNLP
ncbi:MAG: hypothetical protein LBN39_10670 [Planctomycetaceae bacterium]|jgi:hypothetical protein|nr:hypothetical protein [Planctomycetaceae bacterium]